MKIITRHHPIIFTFFIFYSKYKIRRSFHKVRIIGEYKDKGQPLLLISNHISWWDGFWAYHLNSKVFGRKFYFMILEEQLKKYWFMNKVGGYPLKKGSRSIIETLRHSAELLRDSRNMVLIFPQGEINSHYADTFHFERGIEHIMRQAGGGIQIILLANLIDYFSKEKPSLYMYFKDYNYTDTDAGSIEKEYNSFYSACLEEQRRRSET